VYPVPRPTFWENDKVAVNNSVFGARHRPRATRAGIPHGAVVFPAPYDLDLDGYVQGSERVGTAGAWTKRAGNVMLYHRTCAVATD